MNSNNNQGQARWGAPLPVSHNVNIGRTPEIPPNSEFNGRDRSESWNDRSRGGGGGGNHPVMGSGGGRGYDTHHEPSNFSRDSRDRDNRDNRSDYRDSSRSGRDGRGNVGASRDDCYSGFSSGRDGRDGRRGDWRDSRGEDRTYDRSRGERRRDDDSWSCMECGDFNDPRDERCPRCRCWRSSSQRGGPRKHDRFHDDKRSGEYYGPPRSPRSDDDCNDDRHSRKKSRSSSGRDDDRRRDNPIKRDWPPAFEASGASYIFDARSGFFYEPASDFFYDPKTKLYYSNKKQQYFQFVAGSTPPFQPIGNAACQAQPAEANGANGVEASSVSKDEILSDQMKPSESKLPDVSLSELKNDKVETKSKIAICLKTTALPQKDSGSVPLKNVLTIEKIKVKEKNVARKESALSAADVTPALPQSHKKHAKDMDKWSERVKEMKGNGVSNANKNEDPSDATSSTKVKVTSSGQPICGLCKRKFANIDKLRTHEMHSALHKDNLAKKAAEDAKTAQKQYTPTEANYRDRTKERRMMYGDMTSHGSAGDSHAENILAQVNPSRTSVGEIKAADLVRPEDSLGDTNVGNKLLQKLGWKSGDALGRTQDGSESQAMGEGGSLAKGRGDVANSLKSDWKRIESLAQGGGRSRQY